MNTSKVKVDVSELIAFFDEKAEGSKGHATAIVAMAGEDLGVALLAHYFQSQNIDTEVLKPCTQGTKSGVRLDRWLLCNRSGHSLLYQVEIKNWSAHAIGGGRLCRSASTADIRDYKIERWNQEWKDGKFLKDSVAKVLIRMECPKNKEHLPVEPLVCFWSAMHPDGDEAPFFAVPLAEGGNFNEVSVFSMSSYVRTLRDATIELEMPDFAARRDWLSRIFPQPGQNKK